MRFNMPLFKGILAQRKLSQLEIALALGIGETYLSKICTGRIKISDNLVKDIAAVLKIPEDMLIITDSDVIKASEAASINRMLNSLRDKLKGESRKAT